MLDAGINIIDTAPIKAVAKIASAARSATAGPGLRLCRRRALDTGRRGGWPGLGRNDYPMPTVTPHAAMHA